MESSAWYAIQVRSQCEFQASNELALRGFEAFLPVTRVHRRWSDRFKTLDCPLFPGYLFSRFHLQDRVRILNLPGIAQIVGAGGKPVPVSESEIQSVQSLVASKVALTPWPYLHAGQRVRIDRGPFEGVEGIVVRAEDGKARVVVSVAILQRSVSAEVERDWIGSVR